ncbi:hypothetical protein DK867_23465 [Ochrobactrum sp. POC9]|uniref:hypothetical protein n=1 Tax=Ochrobactrum sp. POC9 TaxID=2203419 RepID=UPI000D707AA0|nr:hypothetical protein [Ochrobactrum sp. POC9]PWU70684.1 hypothetical protein DK867_23465 [Ochrobactrum sp. POC9]
MELSLSQAAKEANVAKSTISRAIEKGRLSARKDDLGRYHIDPAELFRVFAPQQRRNTETQQSEHDATGLEREVEHLRAMLAMMQDREADLKAERDSWRDQAQRLALPTAERNGLLSKLFRRAS